MKQHEDSSSHKLAMEVFHKNGEKTIEKKLEKLSEIDGLGERVGIIFADVVWMVTRWMSNDFCWSNAVLPPKYAINHLSV